MSILELPADQAALVEAIARRVVEMLDERHAPARARGLLSAAELAAELGVARSFVYQHADELGAERLGGGQKPRLRFDLERARAALACYGGKPSQARNLGGDGQSDPPPRGGRRRLPSGMPKPGSVLSVRGPGGAR